MEEVDNGNDRFYVEGRELFDFRNRSPVERYKARRLEPLGVIKTDSLRTRRNKKISFMRFVELVLDESRAQIVVMNERVYLAEADLHQFVFVTWDLEEEKISNVSEYQETCTPIMQNPFKINA